MMRKRNTIIDLPEDLVVEILSRVPVLSLAQLRSTSRKWNALVKDEKFAKKQSANVLRRRHSTLGIMLAATRVSLVSINLLHGSHNDDDPSHVKVLGQLSLKDPLSNNSSEQVKIHNVFQYNGLLLCSTKDKRLVVCNPCSGVSRWIQPRNSYQVSDSYALGFDNQSSCYKILMIERGGRRLIYQSTYEIYDLTSNTWRVVGETSDLFFPTSGWNYGVSLKGNTYLLVQQYPKNGILASFDFSTEILQTLALPNNFHQVMALSVFGEDQLCLLSQSLRITSADVWVTSKIETSSGSVVMSWSKLLTMETDIFKTSPWRGFFVDHEKNFLVRCGKAEVCLHIVGEDQDQCIKVNHSLGELSERRHLYSYVPSLEDAKREEEAIVPEPY